MPDSKVVLKIEKPHFTIRLYEDQMQVDMKGSVRNDIEEALENKPVLRQTIGALLGMFVPLHVRLSHIDSARMNDKGEVKLVLPLHRDFVIPLEPKEAKELVQKLNELIPEEKAKEVERLIKQQRQSRIVGTEREPSHEVLVETGTLATAKPSGMLRKEREAEKKIQEEIERDE